MRYFRALYSTACWCSSTPRSIGLTGTCRGATQRVASGTSVGSCTSASRHSSIERRGENGALWCTCWYGGKDVVELQSLSIYIKIKIQEKHNILDCEKTIEQLVHKYNVKSRDNTCQHHNHLDKLEHFHSMFHRSDRNV